MSRSERVATFALMLLVLFGVLAAPSIMNSQSVQMTQEQAQAAVDQARARCKANVGSCLPWLSEDVKVREAWYASLPGDPDSALRMNEIDIRLEALESLSKQNVATLWETKERSAMLEQTNRDLQVMIKDQHSRIDILDERTVDLDERLKALEADGVVAAPGDGQRVARLQ